MLKKRKNAMLFIHRALAFCTAIGAVLAQIPGSDNEGVVPIQVTMGISLGVVSGIKLDESVVKATLATVIASMGVRET
jgi:uncharacterized protein (DUF697 family)